MSAEPSALWTMPSRVGQRISATIAMGLLTGSRAISSAEKDNGTAVFAATSFCLNVFSNNVV